MQQTAKDKRKQKDNQIVLQNNNQALHVCSSLKLIPSKWERGKSLLCKHWKCIPKFLSGKKLEKNYTLQILNFILVIYEIKIPPMWCIVKFYWFSCIAKCSKNRHKINVTPYGEIFKQFITT